MKIIKMNRSRKSLVLFQQLHGISMEESQHEYMLKQQELIDALTDEMTELYRTQEVTEKILECIYLLQIIIELLKQKNEYSIYIYGAPERAVFPKIYSEFI